LDRNPVVAVEVDEQLVDLTVRYWGAPELVVEATINKSVVLPKTPVTAKAAQGVVVLTPTLGFLMPPEPSDWAKTVRIAGYGKENFILMLRFILGNPDVIIIWHTLKTLFKIR